MSNNVKGLLEG